MANKWITWGLEEAPLTNMGELLLFLIVADAANPDGYAWPGNKTLAKYMRMEVRSVQRIMRRLEKKDLVAVFERVRKNGSDTSNGYQLRKGAETKIIVPDDNWRLVERKADEPEGDDTPVMGGMTPRSGGGDTPVMGGMTHQSSPGVTQESSPEPLLEPTLEPQEITIAPIGAVPLSSSLLEASSSSHLTDDAETSLNHQGAAAPGLYPCAGNDIGSLISAWLRWTPVDLLPTFRGRSVDASKHYANKTIRAYAEVLWQRGYRPNDFIDFLRELISRQKFAPDAYISSLTSWSFAWVASRVEGHAVQRRKTQLYTFDAPRIFPMHPKAQSGNAEVDALMLWADGKDHTITGYSIDMPQRIFTAAEYELLKAGTPLPEEVESL